MPSSDPAPSPNRVLERMRERLLVALTNGPAIQCRPHRSRQRIDFHALQRLGDASPTLMLRQLLGDEAHARCTAQTPQPREGDDPKPWKDQESLVAKLRGIAEDARTYEQDTGAHALHIGFPLLHIAQTATARHMLAPIVFIPISMSLSRGIRRTIDLRCSGDGIDRVIPNRALLAWIERQTGQIPGDLFADPEGEDCWKEINELAAFIAAATGARFEQSLGLETELHPATGDESSDKASILPAAVLGLFPQTNEALLRDTRELMTETITGPLAQFVQLAKPLPIPPGEALPDRLISDADPFQAKAVRLSREAPALVIHGPPGTGKSQTITNIIGDHLARGQRVLVVSDKRTALDVVANRLRHLGLGSFFGVVHNPQRDRRDLYKALRQQLEDLPQAQGHPRAQRELEEVDQQLQATHTQIGSYFAALAKTDSHGRLLADLIAEWFSLGPGDGQFQSDPSLTLDLLNAHQRDIESLLHRASSVDYTRNPWCGASGITLAAFMNRSMSEFRAAMTRCVAAAQAADATLDPDIPPFASDLPLNEQAIARIEWAQKLADLLLATDPSVLAMWASCTADQARAAKVALDAAASDFTLLKASALDEGLLNQSRLAADKAEHLPSLSQCSEQSVVLREYAQAYRNASNRIVTVAAAAPDASLEAVVHWLSQDPAARERARKRLIAMGTLIKSLAATHLDRQLAIQFERAPISIEQVIQWLPILHEYVYAASKWYAFLNPAHKKAAAPIARYFGLSLDASSGQRMRDFLTALRHRLDLKSDLENSILPSSLAALPIDDELLVIYKEHLTVLRAACDVSLPTIQGANLPTHAVHALIRSSADAATLVLRAWNLDLSPATADRLATFLNRLAARLNLFEIAKTHWHYAGSLFDDERLIHAVTHHQDAAHFLYAAASHPVMSLLLKLFQDALSSPIRGLARVEGLRKSEHRAKAIHALLDSLRNCGLIADSWLAQFDADQRSGAQAGPATTALAERLHELEAVLRIREGIAQLPKPLKAAVEGLFASTLDADHSIASLRRNVLAGEIRRRLDADPPLHQSDATSMRTALDHLRFLHQERQQLSRQVVRHRWLMAQRQQLLANEGSRLGHAGAELRRRLTLRGERATRLRQVIQMGRAIAGGDPLFTLCPIWMASPETVAQIFPRETIFDVVIFDEASQCRLEEALPVLTRAKRVVIAGDPQQLPPTRFFEAGIEESEEDAIETEQELFEAHQGQTEDLLTAALGLGIQECSLDVHYRSRHAQLIQFSNEQFYASRLQPIPGRPADVPPPSPVKLYRVDGSYDKRRNLKEAEEICRLVRQLLDRDDPPSIGIACFNLPQRDLIVELLDEEAEKDAAFAQKLQAARKREGIGSFEGLFVKNLENVQGDERDDLIISTTYGPDARSKFRRHFGPIGQTGGGRRLNVLITRARSAVHLVTSIPRDAYTSLPPIPEGQSAGGAYLLLAYIRYAESLQHAQSVEPRLPGRVKIWPTRHPSPLVDALARRMTEEGIAGDAYWGGEGFCVDLVRHHEGQVTGLLCDAPRFEAADPVEWDAFRAAMLESQGWTLQRLWSPHFFRDPEGVR